MIERKSLLVPFGFLIVEKKLSLGNRKLILHKGLFASVIIKSRSSAISNLAFLKFFRIFYLVHALV